MSRRASDLQDLISRLAQMSSAERLKVLDLIGPEARARITPMLPQPEQIGLSAALKSLADTVNRGARPAGMTPKGVASLRAALGAVEQRNVKGEGSRSKVDRADAV